jgi:hypothetical protein
MINNPIAMAAGENSSKSAVFRGYGDDSNTGN